MAMTEEDKQIVQAMIDESLSKQNGPKLSPDWIELREEIKEYCKKQYPNSTKWYSLQLQIYGVIRTSLNIHRIDSITGDQLPKAREAFEFIKHQREEVKS